MLHTIHRTSDTALLDSLSSVRTRRPDHEDLFNFFHNRRWKRNEARKAIQHGLGLERTIGHPFVWLCVTNKGAMQVIENALGLIDLPDGWRNRGYPMDPNVGESLDFYAHPGVVFRLTRNLDKDRGFVNGAIGVVKKVLAHDDDGCPYVFTGAPRASWCSCILSGTAKRRFCHVPMVMPRLSGGLMVRLCTTAAYGSTIAIQPKEGMAMSP